MESAPKTLSSHGANCPTRIVDFRIRNPRLSRITLRRENCPTRILDFRIRNPRLSRITLCGENCPTRILDFRIRYGIQGFLGLPYVGRTVLQES